MHKDFNARTRLLTTIAAVAVAGFAAAPGLAQTIDAPPAELPADQVGEDIIVTGIRGSIERASEIKRNSNQIVDAISAEDLGKLPDTNIAEGLQRITGVQIQRTGGEGNAFQIRGANENLTLVNGREVAPDADTGGTPNPVRQVNLFNYPSELFSEVLVYKSPSAALVEGGVGGTVDLRMPDPLRAAERVVVSGQVGQLSLQNKKTYGLTFVTSQRFGDNLGVVFGATYFKRNVTTDSYGGSAYTLLNTLDVTGDGVADPNVVLPLNMTYNREVNQRARLTLNALIAWEPTDTIRGYLDASLIKQTNDRRRSFIGFNFNAAQSPVPATAATTTAESDGTTTVLAGTFRNVANTQDALNQDDDRNLYSLAYGTVWRPNDRLTVKAEAGRSWSKVDQFATVYQTQQNSNIVATFDIRPEVPIVDVASGGAIDDASAYRIAVVNVRNTVYEPDLTQTRLDLEYEFDGFIEKIAVGGRLARSFFDAQVLNNRYANSFPIGTNIPATRFPEYIEQRTLDNFLGGAGNGLPTRFVVTSVPGTAEAGLDLLLKFGDPGPLRPIPESNYRDRRVDEGGLCPARLRNRCVR